MKYSPLQLIEYFVPELSFSANPNFDPDKDCDGGTEEFSVATVANRQTTPEGFLGSPWLVEMHISQLVKEGKNFPYQFKLVIIGMFSFRDGTVVGDQENQFVRVNGSSILYGAAREILRSMTTLGPWQRLVIPGVSFYEKQSGQAEQLAAVTKAD